LRTGKIVQAQQNLRLQLRHLRNKMLSGLRSAKPFSKLLRRGIIAAVMLRLRSQVFGIIGQRISATRAWRKLAAASEKRLSSR
jgi:hypothetical protein